MEAIREDSASWHLSPIWNEWTNAFSIILAPPIFVSRGPGGAADLYWFPVPCALAQLALL